MINKIEKTAATMSVGSPLQNFEFYTSITLLTAVVIFQIRSSTKKKKPWILF